MKVKIYSDGADRATMLEMAVNPLIQGITTNPSLMRKAGVKDYRAFSKEMLSLIRDKPISFEVFADDFVGMVQQAQEIKTWGTNVYVKIPISNTEGFSTEKIIRELSHKNIKLNVTAVFTLAQVWDAAQALKGGAPSIISVFAGRIADSGRDPMPIMQAASEICQSTDQKIELLWASSREPYNVIQAELSGCQIITVTADIVKKIPGFLKKDLNQLSLETVKTFKSDSDSAGYTL